MTIDEIMNEHRKRFAPHRRWIIVEIDGRYEMHEWSPEGVAPPATYGTARQVAARLLQLLGIGPVAPQTWPEEVCIGHMQQGPIRHD